MCKFQSYAARFAAKEAVYKALSPINDEEATWKDIEILRNENGKPKACLKGFLKEYAEE
jgi:holo-[acyl-carrier protein] synthase